MLPLPNGRPLARAPRPFHIALDPAGPARSARPDLRALAASRLARWVIAVLFTLCVLFVLVPSHTHLPRPLDFTWKHRENPHHPHHVVLQAPPPPTPPPFKHRPPPPPTDGDETALWAARAGRVKQAFVDAYGAYERVAFPKDELRPLTNAGFDNFNGWAVSMVDGLDTMILMGLDDLSNRSVAHIAQLRFDEDNFVPFFETTIRYLGGLLSAYALTGHPVLLARADDLGRRLLPAFNTSVGLPAFAVNVGTGETRDGWQGTSLIFAEVASCQMEFRYLAHLTGRTEYIKAVDRVTNHLAAMHVKDGLYPLTYSKTTGKSLGDKSRHGVGAYADSAYEYLLKQWLLTNRTEPRFLDLYTASADGILEHLLYLSPAPRELLYVTDVMPGAGPAATASWEPSGIFEHLSCFLPGVLALGAAMLPAPAAALGSAEKVVSEAAKKATTGPREHAWAAAGLARACGALYADTATGLAPDVVLLQPARAPADAGGAAPQPRATRWMARVREWEAGRAQGGASADADDADADDAGAAGPPGVRASPAVSDPTERGYVLRDGSYLLRPETIESYFVLWRTTGAREWRERGWALFEALERHARRPDGAYASVLFVDKVPPQMKNEMPSFFLAETLKYAYLLFTDEELVPLDRWTFNTEAHPFPVFEWADWEKKLFGLDTGVSAAR